MMKFSTRSAAVDAFGLGMTFYFMRSKTDPMYMQHRHKTWTDDVTKSVLNHRSSVWQSLPKRFADLILHCTRDNQPERCDVAQVMGELQRLYDAILNPHSVRAADLLCHELAYRCCENISQNDQLVWDYDRQKAELSLPSGVTLILTCDDFKHMVNGFLQWNKTGGNEFKNVRKYLKAHVDHTISTLSKGGYDIIGHPSFSTGESSFNFMCKCDTLAANLAQKSQCLADAIGNLRLE